MSSGWGNTWLSNWEKPPRVPLQCQVYTSIFSKWDGDVGTSFHAKQNNGPSSRLEAGKTGLFLTCGGKLSVPLEWGRVSRETSGVSLSVSRTLLSSKGNLGFLWKHCNVKEPPKVSRGEFFSLRGFVAESFGFLSSCVST